MTMNVNWTRVFVVFSVCSVLSITGFSGNAASGNMMVRGILQHVVGIGGETTGLAILLDAPTEVDRESLNQLEIEGDNATLDKLLDKYVQASGTIVYHTGVERGKWPVLKVNDVKEVRPDGKAEWNLGQSMVSLSLEPADIVWKNIAGKSSGVQPKLTFSITNNSRSDLVFKFKSSAQVCFSTRDAATREDIWKYPEVSSDVLTNLTVKTGKSFSVSTVLPEKAAPSPGTYILKGSICGYEEYRLTAQFVVGVS